MEKQHPTYFQDVLAPNQTRIKLVQSQKNTRIRLSFNSVKAEFTLTTPKPLTHFEIHSFLKRSYGWMEKQLQKPKPIVPSVIIRDGEKVSILGKIYMLCCIVDLRKNIVFKENTIEIYGPPSSFAATFEVHIKEMLHRILFQRCYVLSKSIGRDFNKITLKDTKTRWASCSSQGNLNFSWRLIFAPSSVVDYLCAHEIAHLVEMNHSTRFWSVVKALDPNFEESKKWLKEEGKKLLHITICSDKTPEPLDYKRIQNVF
ncbi:MAG: M48 family metallopeptidase [Proteobacteria bacterium]|nr:M48 family metallopeptidase [Pseudomonadota bacterium]